MLTRRFYDRADEMLQAMTSATYTMVGRGEINQMRILGNRRSHVPMIGVSVNG